MTLFYSLQKKLRIEFTFWLWRQEVILAEISGAFFATRVMKYSSVFRFTALH